MLFIWLYVYNSLFINSSDYSDSRKGLTGTGIGVIKVSSSDDENSDSYETETIVPV